MSVARDKATKRRLYTVTESLRCTDTVSDGPTEALEFLAYEASVIYATESTRGVESQESRDSVGPVAHVAKEEGITVRAQPCGHQ